MMDISKFYRSRFDSNQPAVTHTNEELSAIASDQTYSPLANIDLKHPSNLGLWGKIKLEDINAEQAFNLRMMSLVSEASMRARETLELAEDHLTGKNKWKDLSKGYDAESVLDQEGLDQFREYIEFLIKTKEAPFVKETLKKLFDKMKSILSRYPNIGPEFDPTSYVPKTALKRPPHLSPEFT